MGARRRYVGVVLAVGLVTTLSPPATVANALTTAVRAPVGAGAAAADVDTGPAGRTVTLVTGDTVQVVNRAGRLEPVRIEPGPGRSGVVFTTNRTGGHLRVTPSDALPLVAAGRVDPRLFDVTTLLSFGYDDRRGDLPLITTGDSTDNRSSGVLSGATAVRAVHGGAAFRRSKNTVATLWRDLTGTGGPGRASGPKLWLDGLRQPQLTASVPQIGAPAAWTAGFTGTGVTVAVVDSGVDAGHPDLSGRVVAARNFVDDDDPRDLTGHGTHVAATIASTGAGTGGHRGVAPGARILSARVCRPGGCFESAILNGMQWAADQGAKVINMSLGGPDTPGQDLIEQAVERITADSGALFVIAAGNDGEDGESTVSSPGSADAALTVGAVTKGDELADFSSRGPRIGDGGIKPDITAPGVDITAARSRDAGPGGPHVSMSGTSMAAPHVAGAAAILAQRHPDWTAAQLKAALVGSARTDPQLSVYEQGAGRVDVAAGVRQTVLAQPASMVVEDQWPTERKPTTRTVTYRNTEPTPVTLALNLRTNAPAGMVTVPRRTVTVPAGGTADVQVSIDTRRATGNRTTGHLIATAGQRTVTTAFAVLVEPEATYGLNLTHLDRSGAPAQNALSAVIDVERQQTVEILAGAGPRRLPKGRYTILTLVIDGARQDTTLLVEPNVVLNRDVSLVLDARSAPPTKVRVPQADAAVVRASALTVVSGVDGPLYSISGTRDTFERFFLGPATRAVRANPAVQSFFLATFARSGTDPADSPYVTNVAWREQGRMFAGLDRTVTRKDLAAVRAAYAAHALPTAAVESTAIWPGATGTVTGATPTRLPGTRTEYLNTDGGVRWHTFLREGDPFGALGNSLGSPVRTYTGGVDYHERRNFAVYGPGFADPPLSDGGWVSRTGDTMRLRPTLLNDSLNWAGFPTNLQRPRITLDRDGERLLDRVGNGFDLTVPAAPGTYVLRADLARGEPQLLSTSVVCQWTFRSRSAPTGRWAPLPLSAVRFHPALNESNAAPAGALNAIPLEVQRQPGSAARMARTLTVEVSYDDGGTWRKAPVLRAGQHGVVFVRHPAGSGFVSLRASSVDADGNRVDQTIIRAYRFG